MFSVDDFKQTLYFQKIQEERLLEIELATNMVIFLVSTQISING